MRIVLAAQRHCHSFRECSDGYLGAAYSDCILSVIPTGFLRIPGEDAFFAASLPGVFGNIEWNGGNQKAASVSLAYSDWVA